MLVTPVNPTEYSTVAGLDQGIQRLVGPLLLPMGKKGQQGEKLMNWSNEKKLDWLFDIGDYTWRIIPFSKWLVTMVSKSPNWGYFPYKRPKWLINRGY